MPAEPPYTVGLDLGQSRDYTALSVIERQLWYGGIVSGSRPQIDGKPDAWNAPSALSPGALRYLMNEDTAVWPDRPPLHLRHLERWRDMSYPDVVDKVKTLLSRWPFTVCDYSLVVDATGVGAAVVDMFRTAGLTVIAVQIHGGDNVNAAAGVVRVPKRDLVSSLQSVMQSDRLKIAAGLDNGETFRREAQNFRVKIDPRTSHDSYSAWRDAEHDDLVLSVAMATWWRDWRYGRYDRQYMQVA